MANTTTKAEREQILSMAAAMLPDHDPDSGELADLATALVNGAGISRERARSYIATAIRRRRGEAVQQRREYIRRGVNLDDASLEHIAAIEAKTPISGASAVIREALRRMAEDL